MNIVLDQGKLRSNSMQRWLESEATPLWTSAGIDEETGTVWEALDHHGVPIRSMDRRLRVQARQAYCFAHTGHIDLAEQLFSFLMEKGFDPETGNLVAVFQPDLEIKTSPHDLYDLAFMLLAAAGLTWAGRDVSAEIDRLMHELDKLRAENGWHESVARQTPRRQNPHMHLFEASLALFSATRDPRHLETAEECLDLFRDVFIQESGLVFELFNSDWGRLPAQQQKIEPGHCVEWVHLLDRYETLTGKRCGVDLKAMFLTAWSVRDANDLFLDQHGVATGLRRLWPQTELLKASVAMERRGVRLPEAASPGAVASRMWAEYFDMACPGGWYDQRNIHKVLISTNMPASSFYHVLTAIRMYSGQSVA